MSPKRSFGWLLNRFGEICGSLLDTMGRLCLQNQTFIKHWSNMGSRRPFGTILKRFGEHLDASWWKWGFQNWSFCVTWSFLEHSGCPLLLHTCYRNPRAASLGLTERHNTRWFSPLTRVGWTGLMVQVLLSLLKWVFVNHNSCHVPYGIERRFCVSRGGKIFFSSGISSWPCWAIVPNS